jgi:DNA-binding GntR family transcriptional regulator
MQIEIVRSNLAGELVTLLRSRIIEGQIPSGRVNEVRLASSLGVSRTPLREALMRLVSEGAVAVIPRHGFYVQPLTEEELEQLYPLRAILDPAALRLAGLPTPERISRLRGINRKLARATTSQEAVRLDDKWHFELLADANPILLGFIEQVVWRTRRYELGLLGRPVNVKGAVEEHNAIVDALEDGDLETACAALVTNMSSGKEPIIEWLRSREQTQ